MVRSPSAAAILFGLLLTVLSPGAAALYPAPTLEADSRLVTWTYGEGGSWLVGNTHVHSAPHTPFTSEELASIYQEIGHDFLVLTDHDRVTPVPEVEGFLLLQGAEVSIRTPTRAPHIVALDVASAPVWVDRTEAEVLDDIAQQGGLSVLAHPEWVCKACSAPSWSLEDIAPLPHYDAIELYTSSTARGRGYEPPGPVLEHWFFALGQGRDVWAVATDDIHHQGGYGEAFIVVQSEEATPEGIMEGIQAGRFMAAIAAEPGGLSPWPSYLGAVDDHLVLVADPARGPARIHIYDETGSLRMTAEDTIEYPLAGDEGRIVVHMEGLDGSHLFLQPMQVHSPEEPLVAELLLEPNLPIDRSVSLGILPVLAALVLLAAARSRG